MTRDQAFQGSLFAEDFLRESIDGLPEWQGLGGEALDDLEWKLRDLLGHFPPEASRNEGQTESDLIWPVLATIGWTASLRQQNLSARGREAVPDGLLFADDAAKEHANECAEDWQRYGFGLAIVESKRWLRPLDRWSGRLGEQTAPSSQMLRYLRRVDDITEGKLRWGILTNGRHWRLYYQGALSVSEQFFEIDLAAVLGLPGQHEDSPAFDPSGRRHWLKVFALVFGPGAFLPGAADNRTLHQRVIDEGRFYQERVSASLSDLVLREVFPNLARAVSEAAPRAPLPEVRDATMILLYRLLFIFYAEDRSLLPVRDSRYDNYALREKVRIDIGNRKHLGDVFSSTAARYWSAVDDLCRAIDQGDASIGLPPYNGGLFERERTPLLTEIRLGDAVMADVIDALSFEQVPAGRRYINYRHLGVRQLGSIYERLLEQELISDGGTIRVRPNIFARKDSGSYFTPDELVSLIVRETVAPLVQRPLDAFAAEASRVASGNLPEERKLGRLKCIDPAAELLDLKICDPAMGSGHFLVHLADYLSDQVIATMADAEAIWSGYSSPLADRIDSIRTKIVGIAEKRGYAIDHAQLDDRNIVRRMVLKRCIYGVDKNPMAVELAKVSLWLHTFTVGAPLSFLDHHLRCGDSLFGSWVKAGIDRAERQGGPIFLREPVDRALRAATPMQLIEGLADAEIAEAHRSADIFVEVTEMTAPLDAFLSLFHAFEWMGIRDRADQSAMHSWLAGQFGDPVAIASGKRELDEETEDEEVARFAKLLEQAQGIAADERFFNWQVTFPNVWSNWEKSGLHGGFDAVIGNPPWDRMKLQQVEWFAARRPEIATMRRAADRKRMIAELFEAGDPLSHEYAIASDRASGALRMARTSGDYPLLSGGDLNVYSLFVERAMNLVKPDGMVGLLVPSGIAADKTAAKFFQGVATEGRLKALYDFENRRGLFPDVAAQFKFCVFVVGPPKIDGPANGAFYLHSVDELDDPERCFPLTPEDFARVNPNTGTAPIFRTRRDAALTTAIFDRLPVLVDRSSGTEVKTWPVKYSRMFDMTNDSGLLRTREELEEKEGAWPIGGNRYDSPSGEWVPLYEGKMVQAFDHRAASIAVNPENLHRPAQPVPATLEQHRDPNWLPDPQFWVLASECGEVPQWNWVLGFKEVTAPTNRRTMIAAILPAAGFGNTLPILKPETAVRNEWLLAANFNATVFDFVARQKVQGQHLNLFIIEQLPVVPPENYEALRFGSKTAGAIVREAVLELTCTAHDMEPFARAMGHVDETGTVKPPFRWDDGRRLQLRAKLDAVYFHLYGITDRDDVRYIYSTFPIVEREEEKAWGCYRSRDICLAWVSALAAGNPDAEIDL